MSSSNRNYLRLAYDRFVKKKSGSSAIQPITTTKEISLLNQQIKNIKTESDETLETMKFVSSVFPLRENRGFNRTTRRRIGINTMRLVALDIELGKLSRKAVEEQGGIRQLDPDTEGVVLSFIGGK